MKALIYEDDRWGNFTPVAYIRPVFDLRCGYWSMYERIGRVLPRAEKAVWVRDYLAPLAKARFGVPVNDPSVFSGDLVLVNGRWLAAGDETIDVSKETVATAGDEIVYAVLKKETASRLWKGDFAAFLAAVRSSLPASAVSATVLLYPWNLIHHNPDVLRKDFVVAGKRGVEGKMAPEAVVYGSKDDVYIAPGAEVHPLVVLDTSGGPIYLDEKAKVFPFSRVEGPCYLGRDTQIMPGSSIREGNSIGSVCRVGGEVEESIFQCYSNKYHDGFIGHSYVGEFVNLGALTTNSDLKNDYSTVSVYLNGSPMDTGDLKVGSFVGDHTKTGIGTFLNTGTVVGMMCNITAAGMLPKSFPSFVWYISGKFMKGFGLEMMLQTSRAAMERRKRTMTAEEEAAIRHVHELTKDARLEAVKKSRRA